MLSEKIDSYFSKFPDLRVLFFFDPTKEYEQEVKELDLPDVQVVFWENNPFSLKVKLVQELANDKVFLYLPMKQPASQEEYHAFPLLALLIANRELQLDNVGGFMEDFQLQRHQKSLVAKYIKELKYANVQKVVQPLLNAANFNESQLQKGLVSAFLKFKTIESWPIIVGRLTILAGDEDTTELDRVLKKIKDLNLEDIVLKRIEEVTAYNAANLNKETLEDVGKSVLYNKLTQTLSEADKDDPYSKFKVSDTTQLTRLNQMLHELDRHPQLNSKFEDLLAKFSKHIKGDKLIEIYGEEANFAEFNTEMIWAIVAKIHTNVASAPEGVIKQLETLSLQTHVNEMVPKLLTYLIQASKMHQRIKQVKTYVLDRPEEYIHEYTNQWYKVDSSYRRAVLSYKSLETSDIPENIDVETIHDTLNATYDKHTDQLNREWLKCLDQFGFNYAEINVPKQYDFYQTEIDPADQKVVVIISDALRYEAGQELLSEMHGDSKNTAEMRFMLASIPSKTNIGMAQLLPGGEMEFNQGEIKIDGTSTASTYRGKILKTAKVNSEAIQFGNLEGMERSDVREIFKNEVVYVYHDVIDAMGDKKRSERRTFDAVEDAVVELKKFVKLLHSSYNVAKVYITADHGFLYNDKKIKEKDQEKLPKADFIQSHNRYFLADTEVSKELSYTFPLSATTQFKDDVLVTIPYSVNRYNKGGVGHQFVHGGGSLQELVIPLIESSRKRTDVTKKVNPMLLKKAGHRIVSNILKLDILQENEVSRLEKERTIKVGLYKDTELVSNEEEILLNATSESPRERISRIELTLSAAASSESFLKLKIFDIEDSLNPIIEERVQNSTLIQPDF
ncbi:BREX-1 system phosphatase PglZ type A [Gilvibacter sp.]|uniref:BREX-1 system phosphatase PglZ type A n=1 Tax=Gilvibacter sp. TaxID=2729997 RepID=UPI003B5282B7